MASLLATFADLLAKDSTWRSKILKVIQYVARLLIVIHGDTGRRSLLIQLALRAAAPLPRLKNIASSISIARRMLYFGETLVYGRTFLSELPAKITAVSLIQSASRPAFVAALCDLIAGIAEDATICGRIGIVDSAALPSWLGRCTELTWASQCFWYAYFGAAKLAEARRALTSARRVCVSATSAGRRGSGGSGTPSTADRAALASAERAHVLALLYMLKCACDCLQAFPAAFGVTSWPERLEVLAGLASALFNAYRSWYGARALLPPAPPQVLALPPVTPEIIPSASPVS
jgi:hypothetical protein